MFILDKLIIVHFIIYYIVNQIFIWYNIYYRYKIWGRIKILDYKIVVNELNLLTKHYKIQIIIIIYIYYIYSLYHMADVN